MLAGWDPDATWWLNDILSIAGPPGLAERRPGANRLDPGSVTLKETAAARTSARARALPRLLAQPMTVHSARRPARGLPRSPRPHPLRSRYALIEPTREMMLTATSQERGGPAESGSALGAEVGAKRLSLTGSGGTGEAATTVSPQARTAFRDQDRAPTAGFEPAHTAPEGVALYGPDQRKRAPTRAARTPIGHSRCDGFLRMPDGLFCSGTKEPAHGRGP